MPPVWMFKLLSYNVVPSHHPVGDCCRPALAGDRLCVSLRRSGIYFSILTLAFAQMMYAIAYSDLFGQVAGHHADQRGNRPADLQLERPAGPIGRTAQTVPHFFGIEMRSTVDLAMGPWEFHLPGRLLLLRHLPGAVVLPVDPHLPLAVRPDAACHQVEPDPDELYRPQHQTLHPGRLCHLGHVCRSCRWPDGLDGSAGRRRADAVDRIGSCGDDDHPRRRRHTHWPDPGRRHHQVLGEHLLQDQRETSCTTWFSFLPESAWRMPWSGSPRGSPAKAGT